MKVCVHYPNLHLADAFESTRLRKTIKGACEAVDILWEEEPSPSTEIAHFLSPLDERMLLRCKRKGIKTVISAFYCENDFRACFLKADGQRKLISEKGLRMMNEADLVFVPTEGLRELSQKEGVKSKIKVLGVGVNLERFSSKSVEANIFPRYFKVRPEDKFVMSVGSYDDEKTLESLKKIASFTPKMHFYFFGSRRNGFLPFHRKWYAKGSPSNLIFEPIVEDDVYRSALMHCTSYLLLDDEHPDQMALMDAFAAGAEVVAIGDQKVNPILEDGKNCHLFKDEMEASLGLSRLYLEKDKAIIMAGYGIAEQCALPRFAKQLKEAYEEILLS